MTINIELTKGIILLIGNIGTGKTTFSSDYESFYWKESIKTFHWDDYIPKILTLPKKEHFQVQKSDIEAKLELFETLIIDGVFVTKTQRAVIINIAKEIGVSISAVIINNGIGDSTSLKNRIENNNSLTPEKWEEIHLENFNDYETPEVEEGFSDVLHYKW